MLTPRKSQENCYCCCGLFYINNKALQALCVLTVCLWVLFVTLFPLLRPIYVRYHNAPIFIAENDDIQQQEGGHWDISRYPLILLDFSGLELSYLTPLGVLDHTIRQGATFHYKGFILEPPSNLSYSDFLKDPIKALFPENTLLVVPRKHQGGGGTLALQFSFSNNQEQDAKTNIVGDFNVRMELVRPSSVFTTTPNNNNHEPSLSWLNALFNPKITNSTALMKNLLKDNPSSEGYPLAKQVLDFRFFGPKASSSSLFFSSDCFYTMKFQSIAHIRSVVAVNQETENNNNYLYEDSSNKYYALNYHGSAYSQVMGREERARIGNMYIVETPKYDGIFKAFERYPKSEIELNALYK